MNTDWIGGGLSSGAAAILADLAQSVGRPGMIGFDTGCYTGWTASQVWPVFKQYTGHFYCVDWLQGNPTSVVGHNFTTETYPSETILLRLLQNIKALGMRDTVSVLVDDSWRIAGLLQDHSVDYVYIGGDHRYTPFKRDLNAWLPKVRKGGVIVGHAYDGDIEPGSPDWKAFSEMPERDCYDHGIHFGVTRGVIEQFGFNGFHRRENLWWETVQ